MRLHPRKYIDTAIQIDITLPADAALIDLTNAVPVAKDKNFIISAIPLNSVLVSQKSGRTKKDRILSEERFGF